MSKYERLARLIKITTLLKSHKKLHRKDLADQCEVSIRTIQRDIDTLCYAGIPIYRSETGYELMQGFFMPPVNLSLEEALNLITAVKASIRNIEKNSQKTIESAISKIIAALPTDTQEQLDKMIDQIGYINTEESIEINESYFELVEA